MSDITMNNTRSFKIYLAYLTARSHILHCFPVFAIMHISILPVSGFSLSSPHLWMLIIQQPFGTYLVLNLIMNIFSIYRSSGVQTNHFASVMEGILFSFSPIIGWFLFCGITRLCFTFGTFNACVFKLLWWIGFLIPIIHSELSH